MNKKFLTTLLSVFLPIFLVGTVVYATTSIGDNITVDDALTVTGLTTLNGNIVLENDEIISNATDGEFTFTGGKIVISPTFNTADSSDQSVEADANLGTSWGISAAGDTQFGAGVMGNVLGANLTTTHNYIAGLIGHYNITGTNASTYPVGAVLGGIGDGTITADGAFVAYIDGDSLITTAGAAFKVMHNNSTPNSGFSYGLDLYDAAHDDYNAVSFNTADIRLQNSATITGTASGSSIGGIVIAATGAGKNGLTVANVSTAATGERQGAYIYAIAGSTSTSGWVKGLEAKAKAHSTSGGTLSEVTAIYANADTKGATVTTTRGIEIKLDTGSGGSVNKAVGLEINRYFVVYPTTSYAIEINKGSSGGTPIWTKDIVLQNGETIDNVTDGIINATGRVSITGVRVADASDTENLNEYFLGIGGNITGVGSAAGKNAKTYMLEISGTRQVGYDTLWADFDDAGIKVSVTNKATNNAASYILRGIDVNAKSRDSGKAGQIWGAYITGESRSGTTITSLYGAQVNVSQGATSHTGNTVGLFIQDQSQAVDAARNYGLMIDTSAYALDRGYGIYLNSGAGSWINALSLDGAIDNVLDFAENDKTNGAYVVTQTAMEGKDADGIIKIDVAGVPYYIPFFAAGDKTVGEW